MYSAVDTCESGRVRTSHKRHCNAFPVERTDDALHGGSPASRRPARADPCLYTKGRLVRRLNAQFLRHCRSLLLPGSHEVCALIDASAATLVVQSFISNGRSYISCPQVNNAGILAANGDSPLEGVPRLPQLYAYCTDTRARRHAVAQGHLLTLAADDQSCAAAACGFHALLVKRRSTADIRRWLGMPWGDTPRGNLSAAAAEVK